MSGPKDYSPPPRYSMAMFNGRLNEVFQIQSQLKLLCVEIERFNIRDQANQINIIGKDELSRLRKQLDKVLKPIVFDYKGRFGQAVYNRINGQIESRIQELYKAVEDCSQLRIDLINLSADYKSFVDYQLFFKQRKSTILSFKQTVLDSLKRRKESLAQGLLLQLEQNINEVEFTLPQAQFQKGFNSIAETEKQQVDNHLLAIEEHINTLRGESSDRILSEFQTIQLNPTITSSTVIDYEAIVGKIKKLIASCEDSTINQHYLAKLQRLQESESLKDIYFYKELHDSIFEAEKSRKLKLEINRVLSDLNQITPYPTLGLNHQHLIKICLNLLDSSAIRKSEIEELRSKLEQLKKQSNTLFEEEGIKQKERLFLKSQLILSLENQGYEVMDDLEVIDFEKENNFLLKIQGQENYLNLKFKEDGSMRYVFQIPENVADLSTDQQKLKLHEMQVTCSEFNEVLQDLAKMGLKINLRSERTIEYDSIVSVPKAERDKITKQSKAKQAGTKTMKKYLS